MKSTKLNFFRTTYPHSIIFLCWMFLFYLFLFLFLNHLDGLKQEEYHTFYDDLSLDNHLVDVNTWKFSLDPGYYTLKITIDDQKIDRVLYNKNELFLTKVDGKTIITGSFLVRIKQGVTVLFVDSPHMVWLDQMDLTYHPTIFSFSTLTYFLWVLIIAFCLLLGWVSFYYMSNLDHKKEIYILLAYALLPFPILVIIFSFLFLIAEQKTLLWTKTTLSEKILFFCSLLFFLLETIVVSLPSIFTLFLILLFFWTFYFIFKYIDIKKFLFPREILFGLFLYFLFAFIFQINISHNMYFNLLPIKPDFSFFFGTNLLAQFSNDFLVSIFAIFFLILVFHYFAKQDYDKASLFERFLVFTIVLFALGFVSFTLTVETWLLLLGFTIYYFVLMKNNTKEILQKYHLPSWMVLTLISLYLLCSLVYLANISLFFDRLVLSYQFVGKNHFAWYEWLLGSNEFPWENFYLLNHDGMIVPVAFIFIFIKWGILGILAYFVLLFYLIFLFVRHFQKEYYNVFYIFVFFIMGIFFLGNGVLLFSAYLWALIGGILGNTNKKADLDL